MKIDLYTKIVLTVIAVALLLNVGLAVLTSKVEIRARVGGKNQVGISHEVETCRHCKGEITCCARRDDK